MACHHVQRLGAPKGPHMHNEGPKKLQITLFPFTAFYRGLLRGPPRGPPHIGFSIKGPLQGSPHQEHPLIKGYPSGAPNEGSHKGPPIEGPHKGPPIEGLHKGPPIEGPHGGPP